MILCRICSLTTQRILAVSEPELYISPDNPKNVGKCDGLMCSNLALFSRDSSPNVLFCIFCLKMRLSTNHFPALSFYRVPHSHICVNLNLSKHARCINVLWEPWLTFWFKIHINCLPKQLVLRLRKSNCLCIICPLYPVGIGNLIFIFLVNSYIDDSSSPSTHPKMTDRDCN